METFQQPRCYHSSIYQMEGVGQEVAVGVVAEEGKKEEEFSNDSSIVNSLSNANN